jgi:Putative cyclase
MRTCEHTSEVQHAQAVERSWSTLYVHPQRIDGGCHAVEMSELPRFVDLPLRNGHPCAWDVWPTPDYFGCLNLQTPERVAAAAKLVTRGAVFALNWEMELPSPPLFGRQPFRHEISGPEGALWVDDVLHDWNTQSSSQWDGFRHVRNHDNGFYGGLDGDAHGVHHWARRGIAGRAVVVDVGRWRASVGRPLTYDAPDPIEVDDVIATLAYQQAEINEGDVLLLRTGWIGWYESITPDQRAAFAAQPRPATPGLRPGADMAEFLWNLHIAAVAADNPMVEVMSPGSLLPPEQRAAIRNDPQRTHEVFTHSWFLPMLGLPLGEMWNLEPLADDCAGDGRYACFLTSAPLNLRSGVASPPNALAMK